MPKINENADFHFTQGVVEKQMRLNCRLVLYLKLFQYIN